LQENGFLTSSSGILAFKKQESPMKLTNYQNQDQKLPLFGIGPALIFVIALLSLIGILLSKTCMRGGNVSGSFRILFDVLGILFLLSGLLVWFFGAVKSDMDQYITTNRLKTDGIFAYTRNPMYAGWWFLLIAIMLFFHNVWLLPVIFLQWLVLTLVLVFTEETWLTKLYGEDYRHYCQRVNRFFPWKRK